MATLDDLDQALDSMHIVSLYRFRGGTAQDRSDKMKKLHRDGLLHHFSTKTEGIESAVWFYKGLCKDPNAVEDIDWNRICELTKLGNDLGYGPAGIITLPDPLDTTYTTYEVSKDQLVINLLPAFDEEKDRRMIENARKSLEWIVESHARRTCVVNWSAATVDATFLPHIPSTVKELKLCGMPKFLYDPVQWRHESKKYFYWIVEFVGKLRDLETLTLSGCGYDSGCLTRLRSWTGQLCIKDESETSEESQESIETDKRDD